MIYVNVEKVLDDFSKAVKDEQYRRIDYNLWRDLKQDKEVELYLDTNSPYEFVDIYWDGARCHESFRINDGSFGEFLYDTFYSNQAYLRGSLQELSNSASTATANISYLKDAWDQYAKTYGTIDLSSVKADVATGYSSYYQPNSISLEVKQDNFYIDNKTINEIIDEATGVSIKTKKEKDNMSNLFKDFEFGSCENDNVKMSMFGVAVKNPAGTWVAYDTKSDNVIDVDILNFSAKYLYKMPVALKDVAIGDVIIHNRKPVFVTAVEDNRVIGIDPAAGEEKAILLTRSPFGFDFVTKIMNLFEGYFDSASVDNPFGNILPLMLINDDKTSSKDLLPLLMLNNNGNNFAQNPMMLYFLLGDKANTGDNLLPLLFLNGSGLGMANKTNVKK